MTPERTSEGKWVLYHTVTGKRFERWSVDGRDMIASGDYTADPTECQMAAATVAAAPIVPAPPPIEIPTPAEHSPGVPLIVTKSADAAPAQAAQLPKARRGR